MYTTASVGHVDLFFGSTFYGYQNRLYFEFLACFCFGRGVCQAYSVTFLPIWICDIVIVEYVIIYSVHLNTIYQINIHNIIKRHINNIHNQTNRQIIIYKSYQQPHPKNNKIIKMLQQNSITKPTYPTPSQPQPQPQTPVYKDLRIDRSSMVKHFTGNKTINECMDRYKNCFWLDCAKKYKKMGMLLQYVKQFMVANFIFVGVGIRKLDGFVNVGFGNLRVLCLESNRIQSIQNISTIYMPVLQQLSLRNNCITSIQPLTKLSTSFSPSTKLIILALDGNKIPDISPLAHSHLHLSTLFLDIATYDTPCGIDLRSITKMENSVKCIVVSNSVFRLTQHYMKNVFINGF